jgi:hypothetical protein
MAHKLSTAVFAQGWLEGQFENMVSKSAEKSNEDPTAHLIASQIQEQWAIFSASFDQLAKENADMERRLIIVRSALA